MNDATCEERIRGHFGWPKERTRAALLALFESGLLGHAGPSAATLTVFPALRAGLEGDLLPWLAGVNDDAPPVMPLVRRLALLAAHMRADPMTLTTQRQVTVRWLERAREVFAAAECTTDFLLGCVVLLDRLGAVRPDPTDPAGKAWRVEPAIREVFAATPADLALAYLEANEGSEGGASLGVVALLERAAAAGEERPTLARLAELGAAWVKGHHRAYNPFHEQHFFATTIAASLRSLRAFGLATVEGGEGGLRARRATPPTVAPRPFRCTVLPTFEIWVAEDADPAGTAELGLLADLSSTDRVARFTLTQQSVARAARAPGGVAAAIERLAAAAEHGLPDNVRSTLEGWARRAVVMHAYRGAVIVTTTAEQAEFLRGRPGVLEEIAPGVHLVRAGRARRDPPRRREGGAPHVRGPRGGRGGPAGGDRLPAARSARRGAAQAPSGLGGARAGAGARDPEGSVDGAASAAGRCLLQESSAPTRSRCENCVAIGRRWRSRSEELRQSR